jgi:cytochrome c oxidase subunit 1
MATVTRPAAPARVLPRPAEAPAGIWSWLTTVDHKRIGVMYGVSSFLLFMVAGVEALIIRLQLGKPENTLVSAEKYNSLFTMHATTMIFMGLMPLSVAFFNYIVPLQIGARDVAFPRLNAFSLWVFILGSLIMGASWLVNAAPDAGWYGYAPLTSRQYSPGLHTDFWVAGLQILGIATIAGGINFFVTIINMRAPGMTMMRLPMFCWTTLITVVLILLAFPVFTIALTALLFDRHFGTHFFDPVLGGDPLLWQHLFWVFGHPEVYILILPAFGVISEIVPVFSRKPLFGYAAMVLATMAIAFLGFGVWAHHMFTTGIGPIALTFFALSTMLIAVPTGVKIFNWLGTMFFGSINLRPPMLFAIGFIGMFVIGGLSGVMHATVPVDWQQNDSYFIVAHIHYVLFGGTMFGLFAALHYWFPKFSGRMLDDKLAQATFWLMLLGFNITFFPMHFLGVAGMPRRMSTYPQGTGWDFWNLVATLGAFLLAASVWAFVLNVFLSLRRGARAGNDPWDGATLEWAIPSPPPVYNFMKIPHVGSRDPLWIEKRAEEAAAEVGLPPRPAVAVVKDPAAARIHMPNPSYWPLVAAFGVAMLFGGFLMPYRLGALPTVTLLGIIVLAVSIYGWAFEPAG